MCNIEFLYVSGFFFRVSVIVVEDVVEGGDEHHA